MGSTIEIQRYVQKEIFVPVLMLRKDVDLLILNAGEDQGADDIKDKLVEVDAEHFSETPSRVAGATHRILWCALGPTKACKVDILIPAELYTGSGVEIPERELYHDEERTFEGHFSDSERRPEGEVLRIAYMPLCALLMLKLRAWADHSRRCASEVQHARIPQDEDDICEMLRVGTRGGALGGVRGRSLKGGEWVLGGFASWGEAEGCIRRFVRKWPGTAGSWVNLGYYT
jgi:hypothetical protein